MSKPSWLVQVRLWQTLSQKGPWNALIFSSYAVVEGPVVNWPDPHLHQANASCHLAGLTEGLWSLRSAHGSAVYSGEAAWHRRGCKAIWKVESAEALNSELGSVTALLPRYLGKSVPLGSFSCQVEFHKVFKASKDHAGKVQNASHSRFQKLSVIFSILIFWERLCYLFFSGGHRALTRMDAQQPGISVDSVFPLPECWAAFLQRCTPILPGQPWAACLV